MQLCLNFLLLHHVVMTHGPLLQYLKFFCFLNPLVILNLKANLNKYRINKLQVYPMKTCFRPRRRSQVSMLFFVYSAHQQLVDWSDRQGC